MSDLRSTLRDFEGHDDHEAYGGHDGHDGHELSANLKNSGLPLTVQYKVQEAAQTR